MNIKTATHPIYVNDNLIENPEMYSSGFDKYYNMVDISSKYNPIYLNGELLAEPTFGADGKKTRVGKILSGIGSAFKWVGGKIVQGSVWLVNEPKKLADGVKATKKKIRNKKELKRHKKRGDVDMELATNTTSLKALPTKESELKQMKDVFTKPLTPLSDIQASKLPKKNIAIINGKQYDASDVPANKPIVVSTDQNGTETVGVNTERMKL